MRVIVETERLLLREIGDDDLDAIAALHAQPEVMRYSPEGHPLSRDESAGFIAWVRQHYATYGYGLWAVIEKPGGRLLGYCGLTTYEIDGRSEVEVGYRLDPAAWGRGYATEAAGACIAYAFEHLGVERVIAITEAANTASIRVAEKNGLRWERSLRIYDIPVELYARSAGGQ